MSEQISTFCDRCNREQERNDDGRGFVNWPADIARRDFDWSLGPEGDICSECQDEAEENADAAK